MLFPQKFSWNWSNSPLACPSCNLLGGFLGIIPLIFSETQGSIMSSSGVMPYRVKFFYKNSLWAKVIKNGVVGQFYTIGSLDLAKIGVKKY